MMQQDLIANQGMQMQLADLVLVVLDLLKGVSAFLRWAVAEIPIVAP
jgi:hypothetical protein